MNELWIKVRNCEFSLGHRTTMELQERVILLRKVDWVICRLVFPNEGWAQSGMQDIIDALSKGSHSVELSMAEALFDMQKMNWRKY